MENDWEPCYGSDSLEVIEEKKIFDGHFKSFETTYKFKKFNKDWSNTISRIRIDKCKAAAVLLYCPNDDTVLLIEQARHAVTSCEINSPWILDIVAGHIENGDNPEDTAIRESVEEAGIHIDKLIFINEYLASCGHSNEVTYVFCGIVNNSFPGSSNHGLVEEEEDIKTHIFKTETAIKLMDTGKIVTASAVIALQWLKLKIIDKS
ncbi:MAG: NUDIX domain-containing protein [Francisellaceae bacterium]|jgi:ADP-ribose pyrophosphatase|nr:NUDIX domain-containing protein [Francisellaceae bacterium]MBT6206887.1 NUDIX domain-containing protein [Francisellaceae bacterium]MBT6538960.1 NUDIX domain-containing protein [Francisellaceae bacterium]